MPRLRSWFFYLCALEGAAAIAALFLIPSEGGRLSFARLALIGFTSAICIGCIYVGKVADRQVNKYTSRLHVYLSICVLTALVLAVLLFLLRYLNPATSLSTYQRLSPLLWYLFLLSLQFFFYLLVQYTGIHPENFSSLKLLYSTAFTVFCLLLLCLLFIFITRLGLTPDSAYWGEPGVPILGWQFGLALVGGICVLGLMFFVRDHLLDFLLPTSLYLLAVFVWLSVPIDVLTNSFYMPINPPGFEPFPYSDAGYYDQMAHSLLIGYPYQGTIPTRPLYIFLLTVLHLLFGENYRNIITGQTLVLAVIPVIFYFLGKKLHSRIAGVTVALFFIFRELTTLLVSSNTRVSNTKTLLVDLPTLLLLILACLFTIRWLDQRSEKSALIAGGVFGLLLLLRTQSMLVLPFVVLVAFLVLGWKDRSTYRLTFFYFLGLFITIFPWLTHNYLHTGQLTFDAPFQYKVIASQYAYSGNLDIDNFDLEGKSLGGRLIEFVLKDPGFVFGFIASHFLAAQIHGLLALPLVKPYNGIFEPINLYWMEWNGTLEWYNFLLLVFYLAVIALGLGSAWRRWRWIGLLPLVFSTAYALATAVGRFSGWRYDLPADWVWYFYFGIGFAEILLQTALLFEAREQGVPEGPKTLPRERSRTIHTRQPLGGFPRLIGFGALFVLFGALPWIIENIAPPRFADLNLWQSEIASISTAPSPARIDTFISQPNAFMQTGRVLYPRFFSKENGLASANPWPAYEVRDYPRIGFLLLHQSSQFVVFPTKRLPEFPHAQDAIVVGCQRDDYVEARWVIFPALKSVYSSPEFSESCSP